MIINHKNPIETLLSIKNKVSFFKTLSTADIKELIEEIKIVTYNKDQLLFRERSISSPYIFYLLSGKLNIIKKNIEDQDIIINVVDEPTLIGELYVLTGQPRNATVKCAKDKTLVLAFQIKDLAYKTFESQFYKNAILELTKKLETMNSIAYKKINIKNNSNTCLLIIDHDDLMESLLYIKKDIPFFSKLSDTYIKKLIRDVKLIEYKNGDIIFEQDSSNSRYLYFLLSGTLDVIIKNINGKETIVNTIKEPTLLGEMHIITSKPRDATIKVTSDHTKIFAIQITEFYHNCLESRFYRNVAQELAHKIEHMNKRV